MRKITKLAVFIFLISSGCAGQDAEVPRAVDENPDTEATLTFYAYEISLNDPTTLFLSLDACEPTVETVDLVETSEQVIITLSQSSPPVSAQEGEEIVQPDCSDTFEAKLQAPLDGRTVIDGSTGIAADS